MYPPIEKALARHRKILSYLQSQPPNLSLLGDSFDILGYHLVDEEPYNLVQFCCRYGKVDHLTALQSEKNEKKNAVMANDFMAIQLAAGTGKLDLVKDLQRSLDIAEMERAVRANEHGAIKQAALGGHLKVIQYLQGYLGYWGKNSVSQKAIQWAAKHGHIHVVHYLESDLSHPEKKEVVQNNNYLVIHWAAGSGHPVMVKRLLSHLNRTEKEKAVKADDYRSIQEAAGIGSLKTIELLEKHLRSYDKPLAVQAENYRAIRLAAAKGHLKILDHLLAHLENYPEEKTSAIQQAIASAATGGHLDIIRPLEEGLSPEEKKKAAKQAIPSAATNGHLDTITHFEKHLDLKEKKEAAKEAILLAAECGHLEVIKHLEEHLDLDERKELALKAIRLAAQNGHLNIVQHLETHLASEEKQKLAKDAILSAIEEDHIDIISHLETHLTLEERKEIVHLVIRKAAENCSEQTLHHFFNLDIALAYAESNPSDYAQYVYSFIAAKLKDIQKRRQAYKQTNPNGTFDLPEEEARLCFYILRNLIRKKGLTRRYAGDHRDNILLLLDIPSVRRLCHQSLNGGQENELLRLASTGHKVAASLLLEIPEVLSLAKVNDFYASERKDGDLDLSERAMVAQLTSRKAGERLRVSFVKQGGAGFFDGSMLTESTGDEPRFL